MFLMYILGCLVTYIGLVILMEDSLIDHDVSEVIDLYIIMLCLSSVFPITLPAVLVIFGTQRILGLLERLRKNENI